MIRNIFRTYPAEIIAAFYLNSFVILKPLLIDNSLSIIIEFGNVLLLMFLYFFFTTDLYEKKRLKFFVTFVCVVTSFLIFETLLRSNGNNSKYFIGLCINGIIPALFLLKVYNLNVFLNMWTFFSILAGVILLKDPFNGYLICGGYMVFGTSILPAYASSALQFFVFKRFFFIIPLLFFLFEIVFFAHKGAVFAALVLLLLMFFFNSNRSVLKKVLYGLGIVYFLLFYKLIIAYLIYIVSKIGVASYSLKGFERMFLYAELEDVASARTRIWENLFFELEDHFALGMGIGNFEIKYGCYPHNFFLEILITYGIPIGIIVFSFIFISLKRVFCNYENKACFSFLIIMFILWFIPMMTSFTYWSVMPFWVFGIACFYFSDNNFFNLQFVNKEKK